MGEFKMAGAFVEARLDRTKLDTGIAKLKGENLKLSVRADLDVATANGRIAALIKARRMKLGVDLDDKAALASITKLTKPKVVKLTANLDDKAAVASLTKLTKARQVKVLAQLDSRTAAAGIAALTKARNIKLMAQLNDAAVKVALQTLTRNRTVKVTADLGNTAGITTALTRLTRERTAKVKIDLDSSQLTSLKDKTYKASVIAAVNQPSFQRVQKALDKLTADRTVRILASADTRVAADEIRNLIRRQRVRIGLDVDTRVAAADIANLTRRRMIRVTADADTAAATARLAALTRDRRVNIRTSMIGSIGSLGGLLGSGGGGGGAAGGMGSMVSSTTALVAAAIGALPMLASLGQSIMAMGPAAAVAAPMILSLASAFAAVKIGTSGIGDAFKAAFAPATSSAGAATAATRQVENAQRSLAKAQVGVKDAEVAAAAARVQAARDIRDAQLSLKNTVSDVAESNRRAAQSVAQAERDLTAAQKAAKQAQLDLTQARRDAATELEDLNNRLEDGHLSERQDILNLQDAQQELDAVKAKGAGATKEEIDKAQLSYDQAVQALEEQQLATKRLAEQAKAANKAGVEGSDQVKNAKQGVIDADQAAADKLQALRDAQIEASRTQVDGVQKIAKAERDLADARANATKAAVDGNRQIADAQAAVADAARALADAQTTSAGGVNKLSDALAKLSPNARAFVGAVTALAPAWRGLKMDVQDALFRGLDKTFQDMTSATLPSLRVGISGTATVLNGMAKNAAGAFSELGKTGMLKQMFAGLNDGLKPLSRVPGQFVTGLAQMSIAASPAFARITTAAGGMADRLSKQLTTAFKNGHLEEVINRALDIAKQFGHLIGDIFGTLGNVMKAASAGGGDALGAIGAVFKELRRITALPEVQKALTSIFQAINAIAGLLAGALGAAIQAVLPVLASLAPFVTQLAHMLGPPIAAMFKAIGAALMPVAKALGPVLITVGGALVKIMTALTPLFGPIGEILTAIVEALLPVLAQALPLFVQLIDGLAGPLLDIVKSLVPLITPIGEILVGIVAALLPVLVKALPMFTQVIEALAGPLTQVIQSLIPMIGPIIGIVTALAMAFLPLVPTLIQLVPPIAQLTLALTSLMLQLLIPLVPIINGLAHALAFTLGAALGVLVPVLTTTIGWITKFVDMVTAGVKWIIDQFTHMYDVLVGHSIIPDLVNAIVGWFTQLWTKTKELFTAIKDAIVGAWNATWAAVKGAWSNAWGWLSSSITGAWTWLRTSVSNLKTSITSTWSTLWGGVRDQVTTIIGTIQTRIGNFKTNLTSAFTTLRDQLGKIWDGVKEKIAAPIRWVIGTVYNSGIASMWNTLAGKISSSLKLPKIALGFNSGGVVPGTGSSDTVPAMLTPNERILSTGQVAKLGGHRAIDAMLGMDRSPRTVGGTGGNPSTREEQGRLHLKRGGIIGAIGDIGSDIAGSVNSGLSWAKDLVVGGLKKAAQSAISSMVRPLIDRVPGGSGDWSGLGKAIPNKALDGILDFLGKEDDKAVGGPGVQRGLSWARGQAGLPYQWAGNGNPSWDCSGLMSAIESVIRGESPHRRWATGAFSGGTAPGGWIHNLMSPFMIGITNAGVGHTAGTIGGVNVESRGGDGIVVGPRARGYNDGLFTDRYGFQPATQFDQGGLLPTGLTTVRNSTGKPEAVLNPEDRAKFEALVRGNFGGDTYQFGDINLNGMALDTAADRRQVARALVEDMKEELRLYDKARS